MPPLIDRTWLWIAATCYLVGAVLGLVALLRERRHSRAAMYIILAAGYTFQTFGLYLRGLAVHGCPLGNKFELIQFTAWSAATLYLVIGPAFRLSLLGFGTALLTALLSIGALLVPSWDATVRTHIFGGNAWIEFHAALALFSYGVFGLLALVSIMYLVRDYGLRNKRIGGSFALLPSIRDLDQIGLRLLGAGVILLALSLAVGSVWWRREPATVNLPKLLATLGVFAAYGLAWLLRLREQLTGRRWAQACALLYLAALLSIAPVNSSRHASPSAGMTKGATR
ncbi:MAG: cytochrome c biogenesis protein CcsA [Verrucomicrobia bacterium]|nr:cytochrome c biogenesis protein CcsA [Verrucomicrobiota bacterium]